MISLVNPTLTLLIKLREDVTKKKNKLGLSWAKLNICLVIRVVDEVEVVINVGGTTCPIRVWWVGG